MFPRLCRNLSQTLSEHRLAISITLAMAAFSFIVHSELCITTMHYPATNFDKVLDFHMRWYPYTLRLMTSNSILLLNYLGFTAKQSFFILQYSLVILLGFSFYRCLLKMGFTKRLGNLGLFLFLSSYPILAAHMEPVHTYDDFWAHLFTILSLTAFVASKPARGVLWFTLACFAREQSLIMLPALVLTAKLINPQRSFSYMAMVAAVPIVIYGTFFAFNFQPPEADRFMLLLKNFEMPLRTSDTLYSVYVSFGFAWVTTLIGLAHKGQSSVARILFWGTILSLPTTVVFALCCALARETRILFPPFLFVLPVSATVINEIYIRLRATLKLSGAVLGLFVFALLIGIGIVVGNIAFPAFEYRQCPRFHRLWAGIQFGLILNLMLYWFRWGFKGFMMGDAATQDR